jgi:hypothetical protein
MVGDHLLHAQPFVRVVRPLKRLQRPVCSSSFDHRRFKQGVR